MYLIALHNIMQWQILTICLWNRFDDFSMYLVSTGIHYTQTGSGLLDILLCALEFVTY